MKERLKEIINILDCDIYWKQCNFLQEDSLYEGEIEFYNRDVCKYISFRDLLKWYLPRLGSWQDEPDCSECEKDYKCSECAEYNADIRIKQIHYDLFFELMDMYVLYNSIDHKKVRY